MAAGKKSGSDQPKKKSRGSSKSIEWRESRPPDDSEEWMTTYADAITLLMAFFVVMFSVSKPDQGRFEEVKEGMIAEFRGEEVQSAMEEAVEVMVSNAEKNGMADIVSFVQEKRGIVITIDSNALYAPGSADLQPAAVPLLDPIVERANNQRLESYAMEVEGHTDSSPIRTKKFPSNWELSAARATNVVRYLVYRGIRRERVKAVAYADTQPKLPEKDILGRPIRENMQKNRRIVIRIKQ